MLSKKVLKDIQSLGLKKFREETGLFVAEGPKVADELLRTVPENIVNVYATAAWQNNTNYTGNITEVSEAELHKISQLKTPNQVLVVLRQFVHKVPATTGFALYLDAVQDPGNFGTIVRIADWFGVKDLVCSRGCADVYHPKVVQSTMASLARVNVYYDEDETWLRTQQQTVYAATLEGEPLTSVPKTETGVLLIGNESKGIRQEFLHRADKRITIERRGEAESLNAAVATGILLSHLLA